MYRKVQSTCGFVESVGKAVLKGGQGYSVALGDVDLPVGSGLKLAFTYFTF